MSLPFVVYSHTDFIDILKIQSFYLANVQNKVLLINKTKINISEITKLFNKVIFYDEALPYASRLKQLCILNCKSVLLIHDNDILIYYNTSIINKLNTFLQNHNLDRIDLQYLDKNKNAESLKFQTQGYNFELSLQTPSSYMYTVNPSIWNLNTLLTIVSEFPDATYRSIELDSVQNFCTKYKIYKLYNHSYMNCGYFKCLPFFIFLHITHGGKLLNPSGITPYNHPPLEPFLLKEYENIRNNFLLETSRQFN